MRKDAQLHHHWEKIPTEIMSNIILVYSVMANEAINKGDFFLAAKSGCWECSATIPGQPEIQNPNPVPAAPQPALSWSSTVARALRCYGCPSKMSQS